MPANLKVKVPFRDELDAAMCKAGVDPTTVTVDYFTIQQSWTDDGGWRVRSQSPEIQARAARWIETWVRRSPKSNVHVSTMADGSTHVRESCYSIGD